MTQTSSLFVTHARTLPELRDEFLSDLHRRLASLDLESRHEKRIGRLAAIARAKLELEATLTFWQEIEMRGAEKPEPSRRSNPYRTLGKMPELPAGENAL